MAHQFTSPAQERLFRTVIRELGEIGYDNTLLLENYKFADHFASTTGTVTASAVAFGQFPPDPTTACFAVALSNRLSGARLINRYRAVGAPRAFEVADDRVVHWRVTPSVSASDCQEVFAPNELARIFRNHEEEWKPSAMMRAKNIAPTGRRQLDFIDVGLMPALEEHVQEKLDPLLRETLNAAQEDYRERHGKYPNSDELFRLLFRAVTGKAMHDRGLPPFSDISGHESPGEFLREVARHYNDPQPILDDSETQTLVLRKLWGGIPFAHLSIDMLAFVWETMLVTDELREQQGIHATPPNVARFIARALIHSAPGEGEHIVEPCCGSGTFLIAALQRLREVLPPDPNLTARHEYFARTLRGFDTESIGLEVSQSCLTLADFPNPNGWYLKEEDVFGTSRQSPHFIESLKRARYVLCNPPFEDFSKRARQRSRDEQQPVELLKRVLSLAPSETEIGFVLPYQLIDGQSYSTVRRSLGERFASLRVVQLPEGVFQYARFPSVLLIARKPVPHGRTHVSFSYVSDGRGFVERNIIDRTEVVQRFPDSIEQGISVPELWELWDFLGHHPKLSLATIDVARGVEWEPFDRNRHILDEPRRGSLPGFHTARKLRCFEPPPVSFLVPENKRRNAWDKPWHLPKVVCNAVRKRQVGPWKIAACPVDLNLICTQNFTVLWPKAPWTSRSLAAVMNGPIACAFMACHENWKHLTKENLSDLPIPSLTENQIANLDALVRQYQSVAAMKDDEVIDHETAERRLTELLKRIDGFVLGAYGLPETLVSDIVLFFDSFDRPATVQYDLGALLDPVSDAASDADDDAVFWSAFELSMAKDRD